MRKLEEAEIVIRKDGESENIKLKINQIIHSVPLWEISTDDRLAQSTHMYIKDITILSSHWLLLFLPSEIRFKKYGN